MSLMGQSAKPSLRSFCHKCPRRKRKICDVTILLSTPSYQHCLFLEAVKFSAVNCGSLTGFSSAATLDLASCP
ncbi:hypothetical protein CDAR_556401 [Caerostris darwini]|uniref:Uncharacterized protein n=1 Tax=Caerostris darwini TaxID=1538125 RepID=A0AAV4SJ90_9ARAC|nr:hypothetical protein CDAR_556401 [Caerostris darwini]